MRLRIKWTDNQGEWAYTAADLSSGCSCVVRVVHSTPNQELQMISSRLRRHSFIVVAALALAAAAAVTPALAGHGVERIARARGEALGSTVTVRGTVSVPTDAFDPGFAIQDGHAGIYVLDSGGAVRALGAEVEVTGTLVESFGLLAIQPAAITALGDGKQVKPHKSKTGR